MRSRNQLPGHFERVSVWIRTAIHTMLPEKWKQNLIFRSGPNVNKWGVEVREIIPNKLGSYDLALRSEMIIRYLKGWRGANISH